MQSQVIDFNRFVAAPWTTTMGSDRLPPTALPRLRDDEFG